MTLISKQTASQQKPNQQKRVKRNMLSATISVAVAVAGGMASGSLSAQASDTEKQQLFALEEVVVTSRRMTESLQQTPLSVTAIDGGKLDQMGIESFSTLDAFTPNLTSGGTMGNGGNVANFSIRGIGGDPGGFITKEGAVGVYIDDIYFARPNGGLLDLIDVESVEVLRGPQGTLFGRNTSGGAIRFVSKKPDAQEFSGKVSAAVGEFNRRDLVGIVNVPLGENLATRVSVAKKQRDGHVVRLNDGVDTGNQDLQAAKVQLRWMPGDWDMNFTLDSLSDSNNGTAKDIPEFYPNAVVPSLLGEDYSDVVTEDPYTVSGGAENYSDYEAWGFTSSLSYDFSDTLGFKSLTGYRTADQRAYNDWDRTKYTVWEEDSTIEIEYLTQEFQLNGSSFDRRLNWVGGVFYMKESPYQFRYRFNPTTGGEPQVEMRDQEVTSYAVFGQGTYSITDKLSTTVGLRWSKDKKKFEGQRGDATGSNSASWDSVSPRLGLEYQWTNDVMVYVSAANGFKAGGFNDRPRPGFENNGITPYEPEDLWTYEAGIRTDLADGRVRLNTTAFYTDYQDMQLAAIHIDRDTNTAVAMTQNAGAATVQGLELDMQWLVMEGWQINAALGLIDFQYDEIGTAEGISLDDQPAQSPELSYTLGSSYSHYLDSGAEVAFNANYGWKDDQWSTNTPSNAVVMEAYGLLNTRLEYFSADTTWSVALFGTNLTDEHYITGGMGNPNDGFMGFMQHEVGRPREIGVEAKYHF